MYFCVREGFALTQMSEGFCNHLQITSEMLNGQVVIDSWYSSDLHIGEQYTLSTSPEFTLRAMELEL